MSSITVESFQVPATTRSDLLAAFKHIVSLNRCPQATDLHVRTLLNYVRTKDREGTGIQRSLEQLADRLVLTVATTRRVIHRAVKEFGLLTVIRQRCTNGRRTINRYSINWPAVSQLTSGFKNTTTYSSCVTTTHTCHFSLSPEAGSTDTPKPLALPHDSSPTVALSDHAPLNCLPSSDWSALPDGFFGLANSLNSYSLQPATALSDHAQLNCPSGSDLFTLLVGSSATTALSDQGPDDVLAKTLSIPTTPALSDHALNATPHDSILNLPAPAHALSDHAPLNCLPSSDRLALPVGFSATTALSDQAPDDMLAKTLSIPTTHALSDHPQTNGRAYSPGFHCWHVYPGLRKAFDLGYAKGRTVGPESRLPGPGFRLQEDEEKAKDLRKFRVETASRRL